MDRIQKLVRYQGELEEKKAELQRLQGKLDSLMEKLHDLYGFKTIEEAEKGLKKMIEEVNKEEKSLDALVDAFEQEYNDVL